MWGCNVSSVCLCGIRHDQVCLGWLVDYTVPVLHLLAHLTPSYGALGELSVYPKALSTQEWSEVSWWPPSLGFSFTITQFLRTDSHIQLCLQTIFIHQSSERAHTSVFVFVWVSCCNFMFSALRRLHAHKILNNQSFHLYSKLYLIDMNYCKNKTNFCFESLDEALKGEI